MSFDRPREFAMALLAGLAEMPEIERELAAAIAECFRRYDTGPFENRFIVGAVVEQILGSASRALGLNVKNAGAHRQAYDLEIDEGLGLSVKYTSSSSRASTVRITNSQGAVGRWETGTLFVVAGVGIGYADAGLAPGITKFGGDGKSLEVSLEKLRALWGVEPARASGAPPIWLEQMPTPPKVDWSFRPVAIAARGNLRTPRLAGDPIALDILQSGESPTLFANFGWSI